MSKSNLCIMKGIEFRYSKFSMPCPCNHVKESCQILAKHTTVQKKMSVEYDSRKEINQPSKTQTKEKQTTTKKQYQKLKGKFSQIQKVVL